MVRKVEVVPHNPDWARLYAEEAARIRDAFGNQLVAIHHIGSTAIPGIRAKPVLDFLVEARDIQRVDGLNGQMEALGYQARGEYGIPGRRYFVQMVGETHLHHVHTFGAGNPQIERHLSFRDYLVAHPEEAQAYSRLKEELARKYPADIDSYMEGKSEFIGEIDRKAREWRAKE